MDRAGQVQLRQEAAGIVGWDQLRHVEHRYDDELLGVRLAGRDGTRITFVRGYSDSALFLDRLDPMAAMRRLPAAMEECRGVEAPPVPGPRPWTRPVNGSWP